MYFTRPEREIPARTSLWIGHSEMSGDMWLRWGNCCSRNDVLLWVHCHACFFPQVDREEPSTLPPLPSYRIPRKWSSLTLWGPDLTDDWEAKSTQESTFTTDSTSGAPGTCLLSKICAPSVQTWCLLQWIQNQHIRDTPTTQVTPKKPTDKGKEMFIFNYLLL